MKFLTAIFVSLGLAQLLPAAESEPDLKAPEWKLAALRNGLNAIDVNSDGREDTIVVARRENYNAHGFESTAIFIWGSTTDAEPESLHIVPIQRASAATPASTKDQLVLRSAGGADGLLNDFRLLINATEHTAVLITAARRFGASFADAQPVVFEFYELARNMEEVPGAPLFYFQAYQRKVSKTPYQDVTEAFEAELGLAKPSEK